MKDTEMQVHTRSMNMKFLNKAYLLAIAAAFALATGPAFAKFSPAVNEDKAQMKVDEIDFSAEQAKLNSDLATLQADTKEGKMAAESKDAEKVYKDRQAIKGEHKDLAADKPGSLQMKMDEAALTREENRLTVDTRILRADTEEGKMAAESKDAERVYKDRQAIKGEHKDLAADNAELIADQKTYVATATVGSGQTSHQP